MNLASLLHPPPLLVEIGPDWLKARHGQDSVELPLERGPDGRLSTPGKENAAVALKNFLKAKSWLPRIPAWCALSSRGVSLRRLSLPGGTGEEFHQRLRLQIEAEFPLPPDELAWGFQPLGQPRRSNGEPARQDLLVAAVRKEWVADYHDLLRACGTEPTFTLAAMARWNACGQPANSFAMLDIGARQSELTIFENAVPTLSRIIYWDGKNVASPANTQVDTLAESIKGSLAGLRLIISGRGVSKEFAERLAWSLGNGCKCERLESAPDDGHSAAICGLEKFTAPGAAPALIIRLEPANGSNSNLAGVNWRTWGTRLGVLAAVALLLPYAEALLLKPHLERKVTAFKTGAERLNVIDRELDFLEGLKLSQPPYLDVLYVLSKSTPPGTRFDSLSLNSHGEVALRGAFHDGQQVADFRNKLIASGFFTNVVVEEQAPTPDRQRVNVRMSAQEKTAAELQSASARLVVNDPDQEPKPATPGIPAAAPSGPPPARKELR